MNDSNVFVWQAWASAGGAARIAEPVHPLFFHLIFGYGHCPFLHSCMFLLTLQRHGKLKWIKTDVQLQIRIYSRIFKWPMTLIRIFENRSFVAFSTPRAFNNTIHCSEMLLLYGEVIISATFLLGCWRSCSWDIYLGRGRSDAPKRPI